MHHSLKRVPENATGVDLVTLEQGRWKVTTRPCVFNVKVQNGLCLFLRSTLEKCAGGISLESRVLGDIKRQYAQVKQFLVSLKDLSKDFLTIETKLVTAGPDSAVLAAEVQWLLAQLLKEGLKITAQAATPARQREAFYYTQTGRLRVAEIQSAAPTQKLENHVREKVRVLIVDDSQTFCLAFSKILSSDKDIEIVGHAFETKTAEALIEKLKPDIMTLDIHMPGRDGLTFLKDLLEVKPMPVVMMSAISASHGPEVLRALELGAVDYIQKPTSPSAFMESAQNICERLKVAAKGRVRSFHANEVSRKTVQKRSVGSSRIHLIAIGASTGGVEALRELITALPEEMPPIVIVQHIPAFFSKSFADRLNTLCKLSVVEATHNEELKPGGVYISPGGQHMEIVRFGSQFRVRLTDGPLVNRHRPSVDLMFRSVAQIAGVKALGVLLTGMGEDGAEGLKELRAAGARTIAQDEATCVVFGMPRAAIERGAAELVCALEEIPTKLVSWVEK